MAVIKKQPFGTAVIHAVATGTTVIAGNSSVSNVIAGTEVQVIGASIRKAIFSSNGSWTIARGSNNVFVCVGTGTVDFAGSGMLLNMDKAANIVLTLSGSSVGSIVVEIAKESI